MNLSLTLRSIAQRLPDRPAVSWDEGALNYVALEAQVLPAIRAGDVVMVKGSLGSRMGPIVKALQRAYPRYASPPLAGEGRQGADASVQG